jgi:hypothetical protein
MSALLEMCVMRQTILEVLAMDKQQMKKEVLQLIKEFINSLNTTEGPFVDENFKMFVLFTSIKDKVENDQPLDVQEKKALKEVFAELMKTDYEKAEEEGYESLLNASFQLIKYGHIYQQYCL